MAQPSGRVVATPEFARVFVSAGVCRAYLKGNGTALRRWHGSELRPFQLVSDGEVGAGSPSDRADAALRVVEPTNAGVHRFQPYTRRAE